jgi:pyrroloquinoline quinone biosynthesis protein E
VSAAPAARDAGVPAVPAPFGMLAELTYRCPLHCPYCSNPLELARYAEELSTAQWLDVISQARALGVLQLHLSGGEPMARKDLTELVTHARSLGLYTNLVTSAMSLTDEAMAQLALAGIDHVQISVQDADPTSADAIAGARGHALKLRAAKAVKAAGLPLTVNVVLHRANHDRIGAIIDLAEQMGADRLELANTQYYGWGLVNRHALMPSRAQLAAAEPIVREARERLKGTMNVIYILADYYSDRPKPCMNGWGAQQLTVTPTGDVLPCPVAAVIPDLEPENVLRTPLADIWYSSSAFNRFRGTEWMQDPCRTCERRELDFGGCRCQAFQLTGDAAATDPVCGLSPQRRLIDEALADAELDAPRPPFVMRTIERRR